MRAEGHSVTEISEVVGVSRMKLMNEHKTSEDCSLNESLFHFNFIATWSKQQDHLPSGWRKNWSEISNLTFRMWFVSSKDLAHEFY